MTHHVEGTSLRNERKGAEQMSALDRQLRALQLGRSAVKVARIFKTLQQPRKIQSKKKILLKTFLNCRKAVKDILAAFCTKALDLLVQIVWEQV